MEDLIQYEFLKLLRRKATVVTMAVSLIATAFLFGLPVLQYRTYSREGAIQGMEGIAHQKACYSAVSGTLTEDDITQTIREYQRLFENPENVGYDGSETKLVDDAYWGFVAPREKLLRVIASNYDDPGEYSGYDKFPTLDLTDGAKFYQSREEKIETLLNTPSRGLSDGEKAYWRELNSQVDTPLQYGYYEGWDVLSSSFELLMFAMLAVCMVIAPVYAGEYQTKTDAILLSARYGKTKLTAAKWIASLLFGLAAFTLHVLIAWGLPLAAFGTDGWNLPVQIANTAIPYPFTFLENALATLGVVYLVLLAMICVTLLLSAKLRSPYLVLAVLVPMLFLPVFLTPDGTAGLYNKILYLLPYRCTMSEISRYVSYSFGGAVLDVLSVRRIVYAIVAATCIPWAGIAWRRHQVA